MRRIFMWETKPKFSIQKMRWGITHKSMLIGLIASTGVMGLACMFDSAVAAASEDADAKAACVTIGNLIKSADHAGLRDFVVRASDHHMSGTTGDSIAQLSDQIVAGNPVIEGPLFLTERNYNDAVHQAWYLLIRNQLPFFLRCDSALTKGHWELTNFDINSDRDQVPLP